MSGMYRILRVADCAAMSSIVVPSASGLGFTRVVCGVKTVKIETRIQETDKQLLSSSIYQ